MFIVGSKSERRGEFDWDIVCLAVASARCWTWFDSEREEVVCFFLDVEGEGEREIDDRSKFSCFGDFLRIDFPGDGSVILW